MSRDQEFAERHREAAERHLSAAERHKVAARRWSDMGDEAASALAQRGSELERALAKLEQDWAAYHEARL